MKMMNDKRNTPSWTQLATLMVTCLLGAQTVAAQRMNERFSQEELRSLPRACLAQESVHKKLHYPLISPDERKQWYATLGESFKHYHHYCWGLVLLRRAANEPAKREYYYRSAAENFQYVIRNATIDFPLLPEVYLRKGNALRFLGNDGAAAVEFANAVKIKADYTPAYAALIDVHVDLDDVEGAVAVLRTGLRHAPQSKILLDKQAQLEERDLKR